MNTKMLARVTRINTSLIEQKKPYVINTDTIDRAGRETEVIVLISDLLPEERIYIHPDEAFWSQTDAEIQQLLADMFYSRLDSASLTRLLDPDVIKSQILPYARSAELVPEFNKYDVAYEMFNDIAIMLVLPIRMIRDDFDRDDNRVIRVTHAMLEQAGITHQEAFWHARKNVERDVFFDSMAAVLGSLLSPGQPSGEDSPLYILTNHDKCNGAGLIYNTQALDEVAAALNTDELIILPSSIHELICLPGGFTDPTDLLQMVTEINATQVMPNERLADNVYLYRDGAVVSLV